MATRFYLHAAVDSTTSGLPSVEQSSLTSAVDATGQSNNRVMDTSVGTSVAGIGTTSTTDTNRNCYFGRWLSPPLFQTSIAANTWTWNFAAEQNQNIANFPVSGSNQPVYVNCYVWRPSTSTKIGTILDGNSASTVDEGGNAERLAHHVTFSGSAVSSMQDGDVVMFEAWFVVTSGASGRTMNMLIDGTTVNTTDNATVTSHASFIETPEDLALAPSLTPVSQTSIQKYHMFNNVTLSSIQKYHIRQNISQSSIQKYHIRQNVSQTSIQRYKLNDVPSDTLLHTSLNQATTANTTQFWQVTGARAISTNKADIQLVFHAPGIIHSLMVRANVNTIPTDGIDFILHKNDGDTSLVVHIPPSTTGLFEDIDPTHAVSVSPGDKICIKSVPGAATGTVNINHQGALFRAETNRASAVQIIATGLGALFNADDATRYWGLGGQILTSQTTEAFTPIKIKKAGVLRNLIINVTANTRTTDTVYTVRKNGTTDTSLAVTVTAGQTGFIENNTNIEEIAEDDTLTLKSVTGSGGGSITVTNTSVEYDNALGYGFGLDLMTGGQAFNFDTTGYFTVHGQTVQRYNTEDQSMGTARDRMEFSNLTAFITINTLDEDAIIKLRRNSVDGAVAVTLPAGQTGFFTDTTNTEIATPGDLVNLELDTTAATTGLIKIANIAIWTDGSLFSANVSQTSIHKYNLSQNILQSSINKYDILNNISQTGIHKYHILNNVAQTNIQKYNIFENILHTSIHKYNIIQNILSESIHKYDILNNVLSNSIHKYNILKNIISETIHKYHILNPTEIAQSIHKYNILNNISQETIHKYNILNNILQSNIHKYDIYQNVLSDSIHKYHIFQNIISQTIHKYNIETLGEVISELISKYHIFENISTESIHKYNILENITASSVHKYHLLQNVLSNSIHKYNIFQNIMTTNIHKYNIFQNIIQTSIQKYDIFQNILSQSIQKYNILENILQTSIHKYHLFENVIAQSIHKYDIEQLGAVIAQLIAKYDIRNNILQSSIQKYHILNTVIQDSIHKYNILNNALQTSVHKYNIIQNILTNSIHKYNIRQNLQIQNIHKYDIRNNVIQTSKHVYDIIVTLFALATSIQKYDIRQNIVSQSIHKYNIGALKKQLISVFGAGKRITIDTPSRVLQDFIKDNFSL